MASCCSDGALNSLAAVTQGWCARAGGTLSKCQMQQLVWSWLPLQRPGKHSQRSVDVYSGEAWQRLPLAWEECKLEDLALKPIFHFVNGVPCPQASLKMVRGPARQEVASILCVMQGATMDINPVSHRSPTQQYGNWQKTVSGIKKSACPFEWDSAGMQ